MASNIIVHAGATPVLPDSDPATMNTDPREVEAKIAPKIRSILPVHFAGHRYNDAFAELPLDLPDDPVMPNIGTPEDFPHATHIGRQIVSLPIFAKMHDSDVAIVIESVTRVVG